MTSTVFFGDILGFSQSARVPGAPGAKDALADVAQLLSREHDVAQYLQKGTPWTARYGLSDSIFLVADFPTPAVCAVAELFFNIAYIKSSTPESAVLLRGALACGEVHPAPAIFPETASANVVGDAVVQAVRLEQSGPKGPRILLAPGGVEAIQGEPIAWILDLVAPSQHEVLWVLPPDPQTASGEMIGHVAQAAVNLLKMYAGQDAVLPHYVAYVDLVVRALLRLQQKRPDVAQVALKRVDLAHALSLVEVIVEREASPSFRLRERLRTLTL